MPDMNLRNLPDKAVYWAPTGYNEYGATIFAAGVEIDCRWLDLQEKFTDSNGEDKISKSLVYTGQDLLLKGYLFKGELDDLTSGAESDPSQEAEAYEIMAWQKIKSISSNWYSRKATL